MDHTHVFIGGLHRSGTSLLGRCLAQHPLVSGFSNTGAAEDEGQHLQTVYHPASRHGGPGRFGFHDQAFLDETSPLVTNDNRRKLVEEWSKHWDMSRPVLLEKSPPNLIRTRFLQALFPDGRQIVIIRHPIAVACATQKWSWTTYTSLVEHWLVCHEHLERDASHLAHLLVLRYEEFVADPDARLAEAYRFIGIDPQPSGLTVRDTINEAYFTRWEANRWNPLKRYDTDRAVERFEERVNRFGYSMREPGRLIAPQALVPAALER
jgi:Sulfotransferase family